MKILVYGAGMIGSIITAQLEKAGYQVSILARGKRAQELRDYGIVSRTFGGQTYHSAHPAVIEKLLPEHDFDLIIVVLRRNHHQDILATLAANPHCQTILFLGNNLGGGQDLITALPAEKVLLGFGGTTGEKRGDIIYYYGNEEQQIAGKIYLGELQGGKTTRLEDIQQVFEKAHFQVVLEKNIDAWLKTHAAIILPLAFGLYACGGSNFRLSKTRDALLMVFRAMHEGLKVIRKNHFPIQPLKYQLLGLLPEPLAIAFLRKLLDSEFARIGLAGHANRAKDEMVFLAREFQILVQKSALNTPNLDTLYRLADPDNESIPEGSKQVSLNWKPIWIVAGVFTGFIGVLSYLLSRKRK